MKNIIILHGVSGLAKEMYFTHLKSTCEQLKLSVIMPSLCGYRDGATYEKWADYFDKIFYLK